MVNYLYDPATLEANHDAFAREGEIIASPALRRALRDGMAAAPKAVTA
jgi:malonyl-CoA decarboxylase